MVSALDDAVGKIVNALKQTGLYDNTLIVFTADVCFNALIADQSTLISLNH